MIMKEKKGKRERELREGNGARKKKNIVCFFSIKVIYNLDLHIYIYKVYMQLWHEIREKWHLGGKEED